MPIRSSLVALLLALAGCNIEFTIRGQSDAALSSEDAASLVDAAQPPDAGAGLDASFQQDATEIVAPGPDAAGPPDADAPGADATAPGPDAAFDWREMSQAQWDRVRAIWAAEAAKGTTGTPTAVQLSESFASVPSDRWTGGVLAPNGRIYGIPMAAPRILEIDPTTTPATARLVGPDLGSGTSKWGGGVLDASGRIFGIPFSAGSVLIIDPRTDPITVTQQPLGAANPGWVGGGRGFDGKIYGYPASRPTVLVIDPSTDPVGVSTLGDLTGLVVDGGGELFGVGGVVPDGRMLLFPYAAQRGALVDPVARTLVQLDPSFAPTGRKWYGAALGLDGKLYAAPELISGIGVADPSVSPPSFGTVASVAANCDGMVLAPSGLLFALPWQGKNVYAFSPQTRATAVIPVVPEAPGAGDWAGGVLAPNGKIYGIPSRAERVLEIDPKAVGSLPLEVLLNGFTNRY